MTRYNLVRPWETLDPWQNLLMKKKGNISACCGRQVGKSTVISVKAAEEAAKWRYNSYKRMAAMDFNK